MHQLIRRTALVEKNGVVCKVQESRVTTVKPDAGRAYFNVCAHAFLVGDHELVDQWERDEAREIAAGAWQSC